MLPLQGVRVRSLVGELRSRMLRGSQKKKKKGEDNHGPMQSLVCGLASPEFFLYHWNKSLFWGESVLADILGDSPRPTTLICCHLHITDPRWPKMPWLPLLSS